MESQINSLHAIFFLKIILIVTQMKTFNAGYVEIDIEINSVLLLLERFLSVFIMKNTGKELENAKEIAVSCMNLFKSN